MHHAPPVAYPVGRCSLCVKALYLLWCVQAAALLAAAYASQPPAGARWAWWLAAVVWLLWLMWLLRRHFGAGVHASSGASEGEGESAGPLPTPMSQAHSNVQYVVWHTTADTAGWALHTQRYSEPMPLVTPQVVWDAGGALLLRVRLDHAHAERPQTPAVSAHADGARASVWLRTWCALKRWSGLVGPHAGGAGWYAPRYTWLWLFERDSPARWPALRRALRPI
jgi:hypothetical protein